MHRRPLLGLSLGVLALTALGGCSSAIEVVPFEGADSGICDAVAAAWPATVAGQAARTDTATESRTVAAWGDPPIVARCGAPVPGPTTDPCLDIAGVDWVAVPLQDATAFTTYGREPAIEVLVPQDYPTAPLLMPAFGDVAALTARTGTPCS